MKVAGSDRGRDDLARLGSALRGLPPHPFLPLVREEFFDGDRYVVVTEWVEGTSLERLLEDQGTPGLPLSSVLAYLSGVAEALSFLNAQRPPIVHGDVRPANMILARGGRVKLVDPRLASPFELKQSGNGAVGFRAPELEFEPPSPASDVYALTVAAVALLTGGLPQAGAPEWEGLDPAQAARLDAAIAAGLAADPEDRPGTAIELVERLGSVWASTLPTGVMTFCVSDIEGSTSLWESQPATMAESLVRHDELIAGVVAAHGGRFLKSMGEGDSTASVFEIPTQALKAAIEATDVLAEESWPGGAPIRVRFGLHTGAAERRGGVYFGTTPNMAARVRGAGGGGEILLSEVTAALVEGDLPDGYAIVDLGAHHLKGIEQPQAIKALTGPGLATAPTASDCPYRGLPAFEARDRRLFFGREEVVREILARVASGRLLAVVGASGSGKSSLLRAGVVAAVEAGEVSATRRARLVTPGAQPPVDLEADQTELLLVDQFEELYTQCRDAELRARFIAALLSRRGPVIIGVRADFYGEMSGNAELAVAVAQNQVLLGPMRDQDLRRAIAEPARLTGLRLEPGLIELVLRDVAGEPGALPLMSHALRETWERRNGRTLTFEAYHESGGVSSAVAKTADAVAEETPEADRPLLRNIFVRLTELGDDVEDTRRRVPIDELVPEGASGQAVRILLERLADARLVILDRGTAEVAHEVLIRRWPMLRQWLEEDREGIRLHRRLGDAARLWEAAARESADLYRGTRLDAAVEWASANRAILNRTERDFLNASLDESARTQRNQLKVNRRLRRALAVSAGLLLAAVGLLVFALVSRHDAVRAEASARSQALAATAESQLTRDPERALLLGRVALGVAPTAAAELAVSEALDANTLRSQLPSFGVQGCQEANFLFLFDRGRIAADNTCDGYVVFADLRTRRIFRRVRVGPSSTDMILSPTRRTLMVATGRNLVTVGVNSGRVRRIFTAPFPIEQLAGPPGQFIAIADKYRVGVVDLRRGRLHLIADGDPSVNVVNGMMSASPHLLLVASLGQTRGHGDLYPGLTVLNVRNGNRRTVSLAAPPELAAVNFLRVSPDRRTWFITGAEINANNNNQVAMTWAVDARTRRVVWAARGPLGAVASPVQASTDGRLLAVGYGTGTADVLDAATGRLVVRDASSASIAAGDLAFPPGDNSLVTVSLDGVFRTWSARGTEQLRFEAPADPAIDFTPDGRSLVLVGKQGEAVARSTARVVRRFPGFPAGSVFNTCNAACFAVSPGLRWLTYLDAGSASPRIIEMDGQTGRHVASVTLPRLDAQGVAPDGRIVAAYVDGTRLFARVIDPRSGRIQDLPSGQSSDGCAATTPSFTRDGSLMAIVDGCIHVVVWDLRSGRIRRTVVLPERAAGSGARLSPDGRYVLVAVLGGAFVRVDVATGKSAQVPGAQAEGNVLAISPNGQFYAIGRQDGTVDVYDARTLQPIRHHALVSSIEALVFSPDSQDLAVEDTSNVVRVWDTCAVCQNPRRLSVLAAQESARGLTPGERRTFNVN
jgi:class 3 adenylate cyclase/WD40 repeat protein/energy-coupling factor transporter ATP-binding protein EcfA2